ncbi:MAG: hypothetical protein ACRDNZ_13950 [Streptosporangiaceae bacterium]
MWALRGLRDGVLTTRWPAKPDEYAMATRGPAMVLTARADPRRPADDAVLDRLCPTGAIRRDDSGSIRLDQGRCIQCGRCIAARPDAFGWRSGPGSAALARSALVVPAVAESAAVLAAMREGLRARTRALRRSVHLRHVDAGSDGSEEWEILALLNPAYDIHRLGIFFTASPRHADVLLVTGSGSRGMTEPLRQTYEAMPHPKVVIAVGTDAIGGGLASPSPATAGGVGDALPVDVWLPGSPPSPFSILHALLLALDTLPAARRDPC